MMVPRGTKNANVRFVLHIHTSYQPPSVDYDMALSTACYVFYIDILKNMIAWTPRTLVAIVRDLAATNSSI